MDCGHGFPSPASCIDCMSDGPLPAPPPVKREGWPFTAEYDGTCGGCPDAIEPGQRIVHMADGTYRHLGRCEKVRHHA